MNYNTDISFWREYPKTYPFASVIIRNGLLYAAPYSLVTENQHCACFGSTEKATDVLVGAGWVQVGFGVNPVFEAVRGIQR